jgi:hypothetical protein
LPVLLALVLVTFIVILGSTYVLSKDAARRARALDLVRELVRLVVAVRGKQLVGEPAAPLAAPGDDPLGAVDEPVSVAVPLTSPRQDEPALR